MDLSSNDYLAHHGILGQKWGVRRFQNEDGSLTAAGKSRYSTGNTAAASKSTDSASSRDSKASSGIDKKKVAKYVAIGAAAVAGTVLAVHGAKTMSEVVRNRSLAVHLDRGHKAVNDIFRVVRQSDDKMWDTAWRKSKARTDAEFMQETMAKVGHRGTARRSNNYANQAMDKEMAEWRNESLLDAIKTAKDFYNIDSSKRNIRYDKTDRWSRD